MLWLLFKPALIVIIISLSKTKALDTETRTFWFISDSRNCILDLEESIYNSKIAKTERHREFRKYNTYN